MKNVVKVGVAEKKKHRTDMKQIPNGYVSDCVEIPGQVILVVDLISYDEKEDPMEYFADEGVRSNWYVVSEEPCSFCGDHHYTQVHTHN